MLTGRIIGNISDTYTVESADKKYPCKARGKFRNVKLTPLVGDIVEFDEKNNYILKILDRKNSLDRPMICNVDYALIVTSLKKPNLSLNLLDKEICSILLANITPIICFTKLDLITPKEQKELNKLSNYYESIGIKVFTNNDISSLKAYLKDKYVVLTGQTGAGKSSLINHLDANFNLKVGEISEALGRGRHTTRHTEFYKIDNIYFADTPGFSSLELNNYTKEEIKNSFIEFRNANCEYRDCMHLKEVNCEIKNKVLNNEILKSRYDNYCDFVSR